MLGLRSWAPFVLAGSLAVAGVVAPAVFAQDQEVEDLFADDDLFEEDDDSLDDLFGEEPAGEAAAAQELGDEQPPELVGELEPAGEADAIADEVDVEEPPAVGPRIDPSLAPDVPSAGLEEIIITGAQSEGTQDLKTADSVASFDAADLAALGATDVADLATFTPNLEIVTTGGTTPTFFIRGIGLNDFNANSSTAVSIYADDVPRASQGLQLATLFDMEDVNILRGPQGTGVARNASAGAIKLYSRKPSGEFGGYLRSSFGSYDEKDIEGAVEAPLGDTLSTRLAFRLRQRDGFGLNRCGGAPAFDDRVRRSLENPNAEGSPLRICGEDVSNQTGVMLPDGLVSPIPVGLPRDVNDADVWSARGLFLWEPELPGLESSWLLKLQGSKRDELSRLGQSIGTIGQLVKRNGEILTSRFGGFDRRGARDQDIIRREERLFRKLTAPLLAACEPNCRPADVRLARVQVREEVFRRLHQGLATLDGEPHRGDYNRVGPTRNDVWGVSLRGDVLLPNDVNFRTITGYDAYDRLVDVDIDFSPNTLVQIRTEDELYQFSQDFQLAGEAGDEVLLSWEAGGYYLREELDVLVENDLGELTAFGVAGRDYVQTTDSFALYANLTFDLGLDFTLDGGLRYNWERKHMDYAFLESGQAPRLDVQTRTWEAPTGSIRLTYHFREDTHAYLKYSRGWKGGHFNATSGAGNVDPVDPESLDAFEAGLRGSWLDGMLDLYAAIFHYDYSNYQLFTTASSFGGVDFVILNAKSVEVLGGELEFTLNPWEWTRLDVAIGWLESQFSDFVQLQQDTVSIGGPGTGDIVFREVNNTGNRLLNSPRFKVSLSGTQRVPLGRFGTLILRYDGAWTDDVSYDATQGRGLPDFVGRAVMPDDSIGQKDYWLHNLNLGYATPDENVELTFWVRNLLDKEYKTYSFDARTFQNTSIHFIGDPRTMGVRLELRF